MRIDEALEHFGTKTGIAKALDITPAAVYQWGEQVPELRAFQLRQLIETNSTGEPKSDRAA